ncbi:MAG TPA: hypothetical protein PLV68_16130, partial [Ilumatobacteraceae bacterium]|nr:hypothetical protein [Ilumatobacteraceae bacterium]
MQFISSNAAGPNEWTNCVALTTSAEAVVLRVNGSLGPVQGDGGEIHLVATGFPVGSQVYPVLGCEGDFEPDDFGSVVGESRTVEFFLNDDLPTDYFFVRVAMAPPSQVSSNCVLVRVVDYLIDPVITIDGSESPDPVVEGTPVDVVGAAFPPERTVTVRTYPASGDCTGDFVTGGAESTDEGDLTFATAATSAAVAGGAMSFQVVV